MKKRIIILFVVLFGFFVFAGLVLSADVKNKDADDNVVYVCNCGTSCKCAPAISKKPGKCGCGNDLVAMHVLKIDGKEAVLCSCGKDCTCRINEKDASKCGCGKPVKRVKLAGMYVCNCGNPNCLCTISDKPGECRCGKPLKKIM